jgi:hypothetical protein
MAVAVKPISGSMERWERRSSAAAQDYVDGTSAPKRPWAESTLAAEGNYKAAVTAAANAGRQGAGVRKAGNAKWKRNIDRKGSANYQTGVTGAGQDWAAGSGPYQQAVASVTLPPRGAKNSAANYQRTQIIGDTQYKLRQAMLGGTR